mmetsp:Transcript_1523/g.4182  ORF Transcript_1523/g.4182 Transcript_1523/m.4182 type:complete len:209 (+) Transcript_1523:767-1393(+)
MTLGQDDLGREVLGGPAQGVGFVHDNLGESEVDQHAVALAIDEDVFWLEVTIADTSVVQMAQRFQDASGVESGVSVWNSVSRLRVDDREQLSSLHQLDQHVKVTVVLESGDEVDDEGVVDGGHDVLLSDDSLHLVVTDDLALAQLLERVRCSRSLVADEPHFSECSHSEDAEFDEILVANGLVEGVAHELQRLSQPADVTDDALNIPA